MSEPRRTGLLNMLGTSQGCQYVIPVYQRNYTWSSDREVKQYLSDLHNVLIGKYKNHFLGIIIYLEKTIDFATREFSVIDGQQRLTTTFLIIYAIKQLLEKSNQTEQVKQLEGQYLTNPYHSDKIKYKLKPLVSDDDVYRCIVENKLDQIHDTDSNVYKNYKYIENYLNGLLIEGYSENDILLALDKLYVVAVPISEEDNAQKIFESINATGVKLTAADLIRNYMLMDLPSDIQEKYYSNYWRKIEEYVSQDSKELELFFRTYIAIKTYTLVPKNSVYRFFVDWVEKSQYSIEDVFKDLFEYAQIYCLLLKADIKKNLPYSLQISVTDFRKISSDSPMSLIMEFYHIYRLGLMTEQSLGSAIYSVNSYLLRRSICDMDSQNISRLFPTLLKKVLDKCQGEYGNVLKILNQEMVGNNAATSGSYMPTDKQMMDFLLNANVYKRPALRVILGRLELHDNSAPVDLSALSIEHLMPQTPTEEWIEELDTDEETYFANLHRIGNLTLATKPDNSKMSNMNWEYKNAILKGTSHLKLNEPLIRIEKWDLNQIEKRSVELIKKICEVYPYPEVSIIDNTDNTVIDELTALDTCRDKAITETNIVMVEKRRIYKTPDNKVGYMLLTSKCYMSGDKEKYWFGYREKRFNEIPDCEKYFLVLGCRTNSTMVVRIPRDYLEKIKGHLNYSVDEDGNPKHYHIIIIKTPSGTVNLQLSKPEMKEIDISEFLVGE